MKIQVLGSGGCTPEPGRESPCILINGKYVVDAGWNSAARMRELKCDPAAVTTVFLTHLHMDHYLGLPGLMFSMGLRSRREASPLRLVIVGPPDGLADIVNHAAAFLRWDVYTHLRLQIEVKPLEPGGAFEDDELAVRTFALEHSATVGPRPQPTVSLGYIFKEKNTGSTFATAWDTSFCPDMVPHIKGQALLFHDAGHSSPADAAETAKRAGVRKLYLVHYGLGNAEQLLKEARAVFPETFLAKEGDTIEV